MPSLPGRTPPLLLELDLTQPLVDGEPTDPVARIRSRGKPRLHPVIQTLHDAATDPRVAALVAKLGTAVPLALAEEVRDAVVAFANSGKPTVGWAETFGESTNGSAAYLLATGFPEIWLQPSGELGLLGVLVETTFLRGALD